MALTLTEVAVEVHADMRRLKPEVVAQAKAAGEAGGASLGSGLTRGAESGLTNDKGKFAGAGAVAAGKFSKGFESGIDGTFAKVAATMAARFTIMGGAAAAAAPGVLQLAGALAPAAGAAAALPAALLAVKAASATMSVAVMGVGEAITAGFTGKAKDAQEALKGLATNARAFATQVIALRPQVEGLQKAVANRFFLPLLNDIQPLARLYLPMLRAGMADLAGPLGGLAEELAQTARSGLVFNTVRLLLDQTANAVVRLRFGIEPLANALAIVVRDTVKQLPGMAQGFADVAARVEAFVTKASQAGRITGAFENGKQTLRDLGAILRNVGSIFGSVFAAANQSGNTLLGTIRDLTGQAAAFFRSATGSGALTSVFATLGQLGQAMRTSLGAVLPAIAESIRVLAPALAGLAAPAADLVKAVAPLLPIVAGLAAQIIRGLTPAIAALAGWLSRNETAVKAILVVLVAYRAAMIAAAAVTAVQAAGGMLAWMRATTIAGNATKIFTGLQYALGAAMRFALGPIGLVITGVAALVAGIVYAYKNHEGFRNLVQKVWAAIKQAAQSVVSWFTGTALPWMKRVWDGIRDSAVAMWERGIRPAIQAMVNFWRNVVAPTAMWLWRNIIQPAFNAIAAIAKAAFAVVQLAVAIVVTYFRSVVAPTVLWLWRNIVQPAFNSIASIVRTSIGIIRVILTTMVTFLRSVVGPIFTWLWRNVVVPVFNGIRSVISTVWNSGIKPIFDKMVSFLKMTVVASFKTSVEAIRTAWDKLKQAALTPVRFVVNSVINPLIGGFNKVAGVFGTTKIDPIRGFAQGGRIPGPDSRGRDNMLAAVYNQGRAAGMIRIGTGEFVVNTDSTAKNEPILNVINRKRGKVTHDDIDPYLDGYRTGGKVGRRKGDGIGDFFNKIKSGLSGAADFVTNPGKALTGIANAAINRIPGAGSLVNILKGMGRKLVEGIGNWLSKNGGGGAIGGAGVAGGWRGMQAIIRNWFPNLGLISGFRPGSRTLSGKLSYHALGRAVDYPPSRALAARIRSTYGARTKELITPFQDLNLHNGRPHRYTGAVWNQHNFAGGNAHVHWAAAHGGLLSPRSRLMPLANIARADFGSVTLARGMNLIENATGKPEPLASPNNDTLKVLMQIADLIARLAPDLASALGDNTRTALRIGRGMAAPAGRF